MKKIFLALAILLSAISFAQPPSVGRLRYDTTIIEKTGGFNELKVRNSTKDSIGGIFTNIGNGWGKWLKPAAVPGGIRIGLDTVLVSGGVGVDIQSLVTAYVESNGNDATAQLNNPAKPFESIDAALDAKGSLSGVINIGIGEFNSPTSSKIRPGTYFIGSGQPVVNNVPALADIYGGITTTSPTALVGGTVLHGTFWVPWNVSNVTVRDLGVDVGSAWCTTFNAGVAADALLFAQDITAGTAADGVHRLQDTLRTGINVMNVTTLCKDATSSVHGALFENMVNPQVVNLKTYYGFAGVVIKTIGGQFTNIEANGHGTHGIVLKDNDYSHCRGVSISNFTIRSIGSFDGDGFSISSGADPGSGSVRFCTIANGTIEGVKVGFHTMAGVPDAMEINNLFIYGCQTFGFDANLGYSHVNNVTTWNNGSTGFTLNNTTAGGTTISNIQALANFGDGISLTANTSGDKIIFTNLVSTNNVSVGLRITGGNVSGIGTIISANGNNNIVGNLANLGVNTSTPSAQFHVKGDGTNNPLRAENLLDVGSDTSGLITIGVDGNGNFKKGTGIYWQKKYADSIWRVPGKDSIFYRISGVTKAIKDSVGAGGGGGGSWGSITGTLSSQTDLNTALNARVNKTDSIAGGYYPYSSNPLGFARLSAAQTFTNENHFEGIQRFIDAGTGNGVILNDNGTVALIEGLTGGNANHPISVGGTYVAIRTGAGYSELVRFVASGMGLGTSSPNASAILDVASTTQGSRPAPPMTQTERNLITGVAGLMIYNTTTNQHNFYDGTEWKSLLNGYVSASNSSTFLGYQAGLVNVENNNTGIGSQSLKSITTGGYGNTALGSRSMFSATTAYENTIIGQDALGLSTAGIGNVAVGLQALYNSTGNYSTAVGYKSMLSLGAGVNNSALGSLSLYANTTGSENTGMGSEALYLNTTGIRNTAVGFRAGRSNVTGSRNVMIGDSAQVTGSASDGIALGFYASAISKQLATSDSINKIKMRGMGRGVAGYVLKDSTGNGDLVLQAEGLSTVARAPLYFLPGSTGIPDSLAIDTGRAITQLATGYDLNKVRDSLNTLISGKQATLVSATNIKTINSTSLLGSGDIVISGGTNEKNLIKTYQALGSPIKSQTVGAQLQAVGSTTSLVDNRTAYMAMDWLEVGATITGVKFYQMTAGSYTADQTNQVGLYSYSGGTLTLVASSANNANLWTGTANTYITAAFSTPYVAAAGQYFVGFVYNSSAQTVAPAIRTAGSLDNSNLQTMDFTNSAKLYGRATGNALPSSLLMSSLTEDSSRPWFAIY